MFLNGGQCGDVNLIVLPPHNHYDYDDMASCGCSLCAQVKDYTMRHKALSERSEGHLQKCRCLTCREKKKVSKQLRGANVQNDFYSELTFAYRNRADIEKCAEQAFMAICTYPLSLARWGAAEDRFTVKQWRTVLGLP